MRLKCHSRIKDGKEHRYWSIVESVRCSRDRVVQRHVLYLGELNDSQRGGWARVASRVTDEAARAASRALSRGPACARTRLVMAWCRSGSMPCAWSGRGSGVRAGWSTSCGSSLRLDAFWRDGCRRGREGTRGINCWRRSCAYRLIDPGSEWRLHRHWFDQCAMGDLLGGGLLPGGKDNLYACPTSSWRTSSALFSHLQERWKDLFGASFEVLLYDLTSTYFESDPPEQPKGLRRFGYSRDKRSDCVQVVIALIVTPEGFPLAYEVLPGNTADKTTLRSFWRKSKRSMARPTASGSWTAASPPKKCWQRCAPQRSARAISRGHAQRQAEQARERAAQTAVAAGPRRRAGQTAAAGQANCTSAPKARPAWTKNAPCADGGCGGSSPGSKNCKPNAQATKLCCSNSEPPRVKPDATGLCVDITMPERPTKKAQRRERTDFTFKRQKRLRIARRREGRYLLRSNLTDTDPANFGTSISSSPKSSKPSKTSRDDLAVRPIYHQQERIEAHILVSFLAYCFHITLRQACADRPRPDPAGGAGEIRRRAHDRRASAHHRRPRRS